MQKGVSLGRFLICDLHVLKNWYKERREDTIYSRFKKLGYYWVK